MNVLQGLPGGAAIRPSDHRHGGGGGPAGGLPLQETDDHADLLGVHGAKVPDHGLADHDQAGVRGGLGVLGNVGRQGIRRGGLLHLLLKWEDRLKIEGALKTGGKPAEIAEMLGVCVKTIYNEIKRGLCLQQKEGYIFQEEYCAEVAERKYQEHLRAKGPEIKLGRDHAFANFVERKIIEEHYSPGAALAYIEAAGLEFETHICETTLYSYIYRGDVFLELTEEHLLYKGERRRDYEQRERAKEAPGDTIEDRPPEVRARNTFGHWEMDSIMGPVGSKAALLVLTERLTRWGLVIRVPDHTAESVVRALNRVERRMGKRFREVFRTITVDNGSEFMDCAGLQRSYRLKGPRTKIYYCHPYSPQERGSNENMNRILRRWFPKGTNFDQVTEAEVAQAAEWMNNYPRRILGWRSAGAVFEEYVAA